MGRGGKKKDKKGKENVGESGDVPSMSSLSISESQPSTSTSQEGTSAPERDPVADAPSATAAAPPPATAAKAPPPQEEEEEDGLGLGLGGGKKKRPRKKKAGDKPAAPATGPAPGSAQPAAATSPPLGAPTPTGLGPAWAAPTAKPGWPAPAPSPGPSSAQQAGPPPGFQAPGPPPKADFPGMGGRPQSTPYAGPPPGFKAAEQVRSPGPQQSSSFAPPPAEQTTKPVQVLLPPVEGHRGRGDSRSSESPLCIYKIPLKIVGNKVMGRKVNVQTNYLPMNIKPMKIHRYDVTFNPDKPKKLLPKAYAASKRKHFPNNLIAFDQMKNIYTLTALPGVDKINRFATNVEFTDDNGKTMNFEVSYKFTGIVDLSTILKYMQNQGTSLNPPTEAIQCVDVILRQGTLESYIKAGRQFFKRPANPIDLGDGFEMWTGLFQSAIFTSRPFVNIDVAHKGFPKEQPLIQAMEKAFRLSIDKPIENQRGRNVDAFKMFIKGLKVVANIGGDVSRTGQRREFICNELVNSPDRIMFTCKDEKTQKEDRMSVLHYFENVKKIRIRYPKLNCMWVGPKDKHIYYPLELLTVSYGQPMNKQLNEIQLATMVREAATPPHERKRKIEEVIKDMNYSQNNYFKQFGLEIKNEFLTVEAKVLTPPRLDVGLPGKPVNPMKGQWMTSNLQTAQMLDSWGLIAIELDPNIIDANNFVSQITVVGNQMGMKVNNPKFQEFNVSMYKLNEMLDRAFKEKLKVLFVIVTGRGKDYYHRVKQIAECEIGVLTQCIKENTCARRMNQQTAKNILLKVNSKLMGVNQSLETMPACIARGGVMIVGADVTHPSPDQKEVIVEFEDMMVEHLQVFRRIQKALPKKIFVFRDGVSEGQFAEVMNSELAAVHKAYQRLAGPDGKPEVLFLLVQKRHHTRFFTMPASQNNVEPGTVVDTQIVHSSELDFYLVSHQAIKGTARPTRYHAVCNDGKIPHDEVEQLTFYLCHLYSRCMRSVSYPTPTYYAHLACLRARSLTYGQKFDNDALEKQPQRLNVLDKMLNASRMFFV